MLENASGSVYVYKKTLAWVGALQHQANVALQTYTLPLASFNNLGKT